MKTLSEEVRRAGWGGFLRRVLAPAALAVVLFLTLIFGWLLPQQERLIIDRKKEMLRELTASAVSILAEMHAEELRGTLSSREARRAAASRIRDMRYGGEGKDYFWITDESPRMVMHPYRPEFEGQDLRDYRDPEGKRLFVESAEKVRAEGEGYVEYRWQWKDDSARVVPKLSYVRGFRPWGWIVGTGIYLEDVRVEMKRLTAHILRGTLGILLLVLLLLLYGLKQSSDIERRRQEAERELRDSEYKYRLLVEAELDQSRESHRTLADRVGLGLFCADPGRGWTFVEASPALERMLGLSEGASLRDKGLLELLVDERDRETLPAEILARGSVQGRVLRVRGGDGRIRTWSLSGAILRERGAFQGLCEGFVEDITLRKAVELRQEQGVAPAQSAVLADARMLGGLARPILACPMATPLGQVAELMRRRDERVVFLHSSDDAVVGMLDAESLGRRMAEPGIGVQTPAHQVMTAPVPALAREAGVLEALEFLRQRRMSHVPLRDTYGRIVGVVGSESLLCAQDDSLSAILRRQRASRGEAELLEAHAGTAGLVRVYLDSGARASAIGRALTAVSDSCTARFVELAVAEQGPAPVPFAFLALGSEGRREQTLLTDQDNALLYADPSAERAEECRDYFLRLGEKVCRGLDKAGYAFCAGRVMANNPEWNQPLSRWRERFRGWVEAADPKALLDVNIFFDFRVVCGEEALSDALREELGPSLKERRAFFVNLAENILEFRPPLGLFGKIVVEREGDHPETFNIKSAIVPIVNFARLYGLQLGARSSNTLERLALLREAGVLTALGHRDLVSAYDFLMDMRLRHQAGQLQEGRRPDNHVDPRTLSRLEGLQMKDAFGQIQLCQERVKMDFLRAG